MKRIYLFIALGTIYATSFAQTWTQKASFIGSIRDYDCGFSIGHYGFIGCGWNGSAYYSDFYKWDQTTNTWSAIANYPGSGNVSPVAFTIEGKGYVGLGENSSARNTDLWRYDTITNTWTQMTSLPGTARYDESVFVLGHKAYIVAGSPGGPPYLNDMWMYDAHTNSWTQKANFPGGKLSGVITFTIGSHGYAGGGFDGSSEHNQFWQYDTNSNTWTSIPNIPFVNGIGGNGRSFVLGSKAYVCIGSTNNTQPLPIGYYYDATTNAWTEFTNMGTHGIERRYSVAFTVGNYGYIGTGIDSNGTYLQDYWQYTDSNFLGTNEISPTMLNGKVALFPNPAINNVKLIYSGLHNGTSDLDIFNATGKEVKAMHFITKHEGNVMVSLSDLTNGTYFYRVTDSSGQSFNGKFVVIK